MRELARVPEGHVLPHDPELNKPPKPVSITLQFEQALLRQHKRDGDDDDD